MKQEITVYFTDGRSTKATDETFEDNDTGVKIIRQTSSTSDKVNLIQFFPWHRISRVDVIESY